ncbi:MAG: methyltransferase domain-containing protein [Verrucomicrobiota bacterium]|jgi:SAM-dependent methyltransferase|nr:methyltransferase domain-containing protein [Verrucomicrobiota bacterium]MEE2615979.1 methyltransferase domain-containing protein [Verrucomicrobiota bacterium]
MQINKERNWESLYQANEIFWDHGEASPGLVDFLSSSNNKMPLGRALVPGCGRGHDARALAIAGWNVTGLDIAPSSIPMAQQLATDNGLDIDFLLGDFLSKKPKIQFDLIFEHTLFCAIDPNRRQDYVTATQQWLKPNGKYLAVNYIITNDDGDPPFSTSAKELDTKFQPYFDLINRWIPRSYENRTGKELMSLWSLK